MPMRKDDEKKLLARPRLLGRLLRGVLACVAFLFAGDAARGDELWLMAALAALGILLLAAAVIREPGCEINLIWARLFGRKPVNCFLFGPLDRWEERRCRGLEKGL